jgi:hypothetical protein
MTKKTAGTELQLPLRKRKLESPLSVTPRRVALVGAGAIEVRLYDGLSSPTETWDSAHALGNKLLKRFPRASSCQIRVNANRRDVLWWRRNGRHLEVSVHHALLGWPKEVLAVVAREPGSWPVLQQRLPSAPRPDLPELHARGRVHDLDALLAVERRRLRDAHRNTKEPMSLSYIADVPVTWGRWPAIPPRRTLRLGSCHHDPVLLRVHPVLDDSTVPSWFVGVVLWHELLHVAIPPHEQESGRRAVHPPRFRRLERVHPHHELALAWEGRHIERLLARCRERCRSR